MAGSRPVFEPGFLSEGGFRVRAGFVSGCAGLCLVSVWIHFVGGSGAYLNRVRFVFGSCLGMCLVLYPGSRMVRVWVRVWFRVWFGFGSCPVRVWFVSGSGLGWCLVRIRSWLVFPES